MKAFVTGATGVVGRSVVQTLLGACHAVVGLARDDAKAAALDSAGVDSVRAQMFDEVSFTMAFEGCSVVCNVAPSVPVWSSAAPA